MNNLWRLSTLSSLVLLQACSLIPNQERPVAPIANAWPIAAQTTSAAMPLTWQAFITDARLRELMRLALSENRDLRIAALSVERARAQYRIQEATLYPALDAKASNNNTRVSSQVVATGNSSIVRTQTVSVGMSAWEVDLFGRLRSLSAQALEMYLATTEAQRAAHMSLISEVASAWLSLAADQELLSLAERTLRAQQDAYQLMQGKAALGAASELELAQAQRTVETAQVEAARYQSQVLRDRNALVLLVGRDIPASLLPGQMESDSQLVRTLPSGVPSEVLQQRPDVLAAEHRLRAANANIGAARAAFFPSLSLTSSLGTASSDLSNLFSGGTQTWTFAPQLTLPLFHAGGLLANLKSAKISRDIAVAEYEKSIQVAFREVADALADDSTLDTQLQAERRRLRASQTSFSLAQARYDAGADSYLTLLDAQRSLYASEQSLIRARLAREINLLSLYKVLGGGVPDTTQNPH